MRFKPWLIEQLGATALAQRAEFAGFAQNEALLGVYDFTPSDLLYAALLHRWLEAAKDGDLLMCHSSHSVSVLADPILAARVAEFGVLSTSGFDRLLREHHVSLAPMRQTLGKTPR